MEDKKYELLKDDKIYHDGYILYRIKRLRDGLIGGYIESEKQLSQKGECFVYDNAMVYGSSFIRDNARVKDNARVCHSIMRDDAVVAHDAFVKNAIIDEHAVISKRAYVKGIVESDNEDLTLIVSGHAIITDDASVTGDSVITGRTVVSGRAYITNAYLEDVDVTENAIICFDERHRIANSVKIRKDVLIRSYKDYCIFRSSRTNTDYIYTRSNDTLTPYEGPSATLASLKDDSFNIGEYYSCEDAEFFRSVVKFIDEFYSEKDL